MRLKIKSFMTIITKTKHAPYQALPKDFVKVVPKIEFLELIPHELVKELGAFVFDKTESQFKIAALDPENRMLQHLVKDRIGSDVSWFIAEESDIAFILSNYKQDFKSEINNIASGSPDINGNLSILVDKIIKYAINEKASDVHIEPLRVEVAVRFRADGVLHTVLTLPKSIHQAIVARFKILANLKIDEYRAPQDGRIEPEEFPGTSLRLSTMPTLYGEKLAMRIMNDSNKDLSIKNLGFSEKQTEIILRNLEKPHGMIVTSGPTGSGKTTTLYALMQLISKDDINISTLEDPVEFALEGVNQVQVNPRANLTFASGLRSLLRQDPDVIMVGEIRDTDTAIMASGAAMTGHLVFTTLHTNDAASAFNRFLEMKVEDFVISSTVNLIIAQRLVRKVCTACATKEKLNDIVLKKIQERDDITKTMENKQKGICAKLDKETFLVGKGCSICLNSGYSGRTGIYELMELNKEIKNHILSHAPSDKIKMAASSQGFNDMIDDGVEKVLAGITTFDEVLRTTKN
jgi:type IV pilus assembly protein PilB